MESDWDSVFQYDPTLDLDYSDGKTVNYAEKDISQIPTPPVREQLSNFSLSHFILWLRLQTVLRQC